MEFDFGRFLINLKFGTLVFGREVTPQPTRALEACASAWRGRRLSADQATPLFWVVPQYNLEEKLFSELNLSSEMCL